MGKVLLITLLFCFTSSSWARNDFLSLFKNEKPIIAAIMVEGDITKPAEYQKALAWSLEQLKTAQEKEMDGILFEFRGGKILKPTLSQAKMQAMINLSKELVKNAKNIVVGVEILWHYPEQTLQLAKESGAKFVRIDFFSDEVIADNEPVPIDPKKVTEYRKTIEASSIVLLTDIQVKYSQMKDPKITLDQSAQKALALGSDGVIVTSTKSGSAPDEERPRKAKLGAGTAPVVIGSGFSAENAENLLKYADAAIVGTSISVKTGGPLVPQKVDRLMKVVAQVRKKVGTKKL